MSRGTRTIEIFRYDPDKDAAPRMQTYQIELLDSDRMLLDVLVRLKKMDETISFRRSCREGICDHEHAATKNYFTPATWFTCRARLSGRYEPIL